MLNNTVQAVYRGQCNTGNLHDIRFLLFAILFLFFCFYVIQIFVLCVRTHFVINFCRLIASAFDVNISFEYERFQLNLKLKNHIVIHRYTLNNVRDDL